MELIEADLKTNAHVLLLNVGGCGLHQFHNAVKAGAQASGWSVDKFLSSLYWLFKHTPTVPTLNGNASFPRKYCNHRWLENIPVCAKATELLAHIKQYVTAVTAKKCTNPKTKSYGIVAENVKDQLLPAKLVFFLSVAKQIQPFLVSYQTDSPMIPFLYST